MTALSRKLHERNAPCQCELCRLTRDMHSGPLNRKQKIAFGVIWDRMESAETDLSILKHQAESEERLHFKGRYWVPLTSKPK